MITDKHWFKENILCLLSNAIKYSNGGRVNVMVTHVPASDPEYQLSMDRESEKFFFDRNSADNLISSHLNNHVSATSTPPLGSSIRSDSKSPLVGVDHQS